MKYTKCLRCGRKLKSEESKSLGFGKVCWEKWNSEKHIRPLFDVVGIDSTIPSSDGANVSVS